MVRPQPISMCEITSGLPQKRKTDLSCGVSQNYLLVIFSLFRNKLFIFDFATLNSWVVVSIGA